MTTSSGMPGRKDRSDWYSPPWSRSRQNTLSAKSNDAAVEGVDFAVEAPAGLLVVAGAIELQQVFVNLIKNAAEAIRHAGGTGQVGVVAAAAGDAVVVTVEDDGPGIPEEKIDVVFDPFYTTKPPGQGTGLGLNVVYRILTKYRGQIQVANRPEGGARFELRLRSAGAATRGA